MVAREDLEAEIAHFLATGDYRTAATRTVDGFGPEVLGFLDAVLNNHDAAREAFALACEDLWRALPRFEGRSSMRTWFYVLARHAASRLRRASRRARQQTPLSQAPENAARTTRSTTQPYLRSSVRDGFAAIRDGLSEQDRALLVLRVDRDMSWREIAEVFAPGAAESAAQRVAAKLRKRFQTVKETIRKRADAAGLLDGDGGDRSHRPPVPRS
jgi:RNA polymerase sigma-70 factor (ECF subfamily)